MNGLLADIYSAGDGLKRRLKGLLSDPVGTAEQSIGNLADQQSRLVTLQDTAYPMPGYSSVLIAPEQKEEARKQLADYGSQLGLLGMAMSKAGKQRLLSNLQTKTVGDAYVLGDISKGQSKAAAGLLGQRPATDDVVMVPVVSEKLINKRLGRDGLYPSDVTLTAEQAMKPSSKVFSDPSKINQWPSLIQENVIDPVTGRRFTAQMPLRVSEDGQTWEAASVVPKGLKRPKNKTPKL